MKNVKEFLKMFVIILWCIARAIYDIMVWVSLIVVAFLLGMAVYSFWCV